MDIGGTALADVLAEYEVYRLGKEVDGDTYLKADPAWFRSIVTGVVKDQKTLDPMIAGAISEGWTLSRLDSTLRAILRAGVSGNRLQARCAHRRHRYRICRDRHRLL